MENFVKKGWKMKILKKNHKKVENLLKNGWKIVEKLIKKI